ncbi:hypothetical protein GmHk_17G049257 [Glycine max]|nr:hypothetical protein GmHk_17G049257 [Glycine max]
MFNRRNSFSSRIKASRSEYESVRRTTKSRSNPQLILLMNLMMLSDNFSIDKETLRKDFYSPENEIQRRWFFQHYKGTNRKQIQDKFYEFVERVKINVLFFDWFHAYTIRKDIDYPWKQDIIGDPTTNVITNWQMKDGELIQLELPPVTQYQLPNVKDSNNKHVMAVPFKTKDVNEEVTSKDIKSLMEQANYTNKYLQVLGETIKTKVIPIEKPLFKPFKVSDKAKRKIRELRKSKSLTEGVGDNHSELLNKTGSLLKVIPETPQTSKNTSKMVTRSTSKLINIINEDSDQNSENATEVGSVSEKNINPINSKHWKTPSKLYYQRPTAPDLLLEERGEIILRVLVQTTSMNEEKSKIYSVVKTDVNGKFITNDDDKEIPDTCRTLADFRWYRDTFLTRVYTREDSQQPFWKENFLAGLPRSLGDKVRDKIHSQSANGDIPYESLSYSQLISYVQKRQLAKEKALTKKDLGSFCEQFGLPACPKQKKKQSSRREIHESKPKPSEEETKTSSSVLSDENLNLIQQDDQLSSTDDDGQINTLTRDKISCLKQSILYLTPRKRSNIFKRLENSSAKPTTFEDLQIEIKNLKKEVKELRQQQEIHQIILSRIEEDSDSESVNNSEGNQPDNLEDDMINSYKILRENLSTANGSKLKINYKLSNAIIENQGLRINTKFLLVKNLKNEVIPGTPFIRALFPIQISNEGITTNYLGRKIIFNFSTKPISRNINLIENKINQINFLKEEVSFNNIQIQQGKPQASGAFLRGGRSTGKGSRLSLLELSTKKSSSTSFGSPTQVGSSTQKTNFEGSSTQIISVKPEPSTQESPKSATAKQTSVDYAWPIETLQALQDMGLTKFPKIIKKSWADIASKSDDDSESNLQTMI